jgi:mannosyltransferase
MKIVLDNIIFALQRAGGISAYWYELLRRMERDSRLLQIIEHPQAVSNIFRRELNLTSTSITSDWPIPLSLTRYLPIKGIKNKHSIHHSSYYRIPYQRRCISVTTVHDFTYERFRRGSAQIIHSWQKRNSVRVASGIICVSESTKRDLLEFYPEVAEKNISVIYHGVSACYRPLISSDQRILNPSFPVAPFILFVGSRDSYKNFHIALESVAMSPEYWFVSVGGGELKPSEAALSKKLLAGKHLHISIVDNEYLNLLYNCAHALLYPSSYEGFGIPIIEAMAAGCPVIAVNVSAIPEASGDAGLLVDDIRPEMFSNQIMRLQNAKFRKEIIQRGYKQAGRFSLETCYQETIAFYEKVMKNV